MQIKLSDSLYHCVIIISIAQLHTLSFDKIKFLLFLKMQNHSKKLQLRNFAMVFITDHTA